MNLYGIYVCMNWQVLRPILINTKHFLVWRLIDSLNCFHKICSYHVLYDGSFVCKNFLKITPVNLKLFIDVLAYVMFARVEPVGQCRLYRNIFWNFNDLMHAPFGVVQMPVPAIVITSSLRGVSAGYEHACFSVCCAMLKDRGRKTLSCAES